MLKPILLLLGIIFTIVVFEFQRFRRALRKSNEDSASDVAIKVYNLEGNPEQQVIPEWNLARGVLVAYPFLIPYALLKEIAQDDKLFILVKNDKQRVKCFKKLEEHLINTGNVEWITSRRSYSHPWTRDWGPYTLRTNEDFSLFDGFFRSYPYSGYDSQNRKLHWLSDLIPFFNTKQDNEAPAAIAEHFKVNRHALPIALTGGAAIFDGQGTLFVCRIVIDENKALGHSFETFKEHIASQLGIKRLIVLPNYRRNGIQHIDCLMKLLDDKRILLKRLDRSHPDYERVEHIAEGLSQIKTLDGDDPGDEQALKTWKTAIPDYEVIGFRVEKWMKPWSFTDALHCRTKGIFIPDDS